MRKETLEQLREYNKMYSQTPRKEEDYDKMMERAYERGSYEEFFVGNFVGKETQHGNKV